MYENFYGLNTKPFHIVPNPAIFYLSPKHENALIYLEYGLLERLGFILLTGEIGTGKTTLVRYLLDKIDPEFETAVIFNTNVTPDQLLGLILNEFELDVEWHNKAQALDRIYQFLIDRFAKQKRTLLIIDEAQNLSREALEEVRMLSNLQSDNQLLIQIMLVGQPQLKIKLRSPDLAQLNQRIGVAYHIAALDLEETKNYIGYRLEKAGGKSELFTSAAMDLIHRASGGIPRTINLLCDAALVYGFADELTRIDTPVIEQVVHDRDGIGIKPDQVELESQPDAGEGNIAHRLLCLEEGLAKLQSQVDWRLDELERRRDGFKDDLVRRLSENSAQERQRNDKLLFEYAQLKERYGALQKKLMDREAFPPSGGADEMVGRMKEILRAEREKTRQLQESYLKLKDDYQVLERRRIQEMQRYIREDGVKVFADRQKTVKVRSWFRS